MMRCHRAIGLLHRAAAAAPHEPHVLRATACDEAAAAAALLTLLPDVVPNVISARRSGEEGGAISYFDPDAAAAGEDAAGFEAPYEWDDMEAEALLRRLNGTSAHFIVLLRTAAERPKTLPTPSQERGPWRPRAT